MSQAAVRLALLCSQFNGEITDRMLKSALDRCRELGTDVRYVCRVPGAFDMPLFISELLDKEDVDAVVTLGAIVKGDTKHDEVIAAALANNIALLSRSKGKPVSLGVSGPGMSWEEATERADDYAARAVDAAVRMSSSLKELRRNREGKEFPAVIE